MFNQHSLREKWFPATITIWGQTLLNQSQISSVIVTTLHFFITLVHPELPAFSHNKQWITGTISAFSRFIKVSELGAQTDAPPISIKWLRHLPAAGQKVLQLQLEVRLWDSWPKGRSLPICWPLSHAGGVWITNIVPRDSPLLSQRRPFLNWRFTIKLIRPQIWRTYFNLSVSVSPPQRRKSRYAELDFEVILVFLLPTEILKHIPKEELLFLDWFRSDVQRKQHWWSIVFIVRNV